MKRERETVKDVNRKATADAHLNFDSWQPFIRNQATSFSKVKGAPCPWSGERKVYEWDTGLCRFKIGHKCATESKDGMLCSTAEA
jgi:hypothetical protein